MLLRGSFVDRSARTGSIAARDESCLPQEVLQQVAIILGQEQDLGLLNDVAKISDKVSTLFGELVGWGGQRFGGNGRVESDVYLFVLVI